MLDAGGILATRRLEAFLAVLEYGGFSRAAERLGVSQPTVSQLVQALERSVGTELLVRGRGAVRPTAAGTALRPHAVALLTVAERAAEAVQSADRDVRRHLRIAAGEALATHVLPPAVSRLRERLPGLVATFVVGDEVRVLEALRGGEVDAALLTDRTDASDLTAHPYTDGRLVLVVSPDDELTTRPRPLAPADLAGTTLVVRDLGTVNRRELEELLRQADVEPRNRLVASSLEAVKRCVEAGLGVTLVPSIAVERELAEGLLVELPLAAEGLDYGFVLCCRGDERLTPPVAALLDILREG